MYKKYINDEIKKSELSQKIIEVLKRTDLYDETNSNHNQFATRALDYPMNDMALCVAIREFDYKIDVYERGQLSGEKATTDLNEVIYLTIIDAINRMVYEKMSVPAGKDTFEIREIERKAGMDKALNQINGIFQQWFLEGRNIYNILEWLN